MRHFDDAIESRAERASEIPNILVNLFRMRRASVGTEY